MNEHTTKVSGLRCSFGTNCGATLSRPWEKGVAQQLRPHADFALLDLELRETSEMAELLADGR